MRFAIADTWDGKAAHTAERVELELSREGLDWVLQVNAPFHGDPEPTRPPGPMPGLWEYEVVELFLVAPKDHYLEVELGPHGHYWVLELRGVRQVIREGLALDFQSNRDGSRWRGRARIAGELVPGGVSWFNAFAIHGHGQARGARRHLAHAPVPGDQPDFHRLGCFPELPGELLKQGLRDHR